MKKTMSTAGKFFKYMVIIYTIGYWLFMMTDNYWLMAKDFNTNWLEYLKIFAIYYIFYLVLLSVCYWIISSVMIYLYHNV